MKPQLLKWMTLCVLLGGHIAASLAQTQFTIMEYTNEWKYLQGYSTPSNWFAVDYDDSAWPHGRGIFAFPTNENVAGQAPVNTALSRDVGGGYIMTDYFRTLLNLSVHPSNLVLSGSAVVDDGAVIYVNGREARRIGMPSGTISYNTAANRGGDVASRVDTFSLGSSNFIQGLNVIAVEVHQESMFSGDAVFGMKLVAQQLEPVSIITHPADQTVDAGHRATFSVQATGSTPQYRWYTNGVLLPGAVGATYTTPNTTLAMGGTIYHVVVSNAVSVARSEPARLTVVPDENGPQILLALATGSNRVEITFNEQVLAATATNSTNFSLHILGTTNTIRITNVIYGVNRLLARAQTALYPTNSYVICVANVSDTKTNVISPNPSCIGVSFVYTDNLVLLGQVWRYNENETSSLPPSWVTLNYNDDPLTPPYHWTEGYGAFGYSFSSFFMPCSPITTWLSIGPRTYYFRKRFLVTEDYPTNVTLSLRHLIDDGAIFYLNGTEIYRIRMPQGPVEHSTPGLYVSDTVCSTVVFPGGGLFVRGTNILAVEVHQALEPSPQAVDVAFDAELMVTYRRPPMIPELRITYTETDAIVTWDGMGWALEAADDLSGSWSRIATADNRYVSPLNAPPGRRFFRLVNP